MSVEIKNGSPPILNQLQNGDGPVDYKIPPGFKEEFKGVWTNFWGGAITEEERKIEIEELLKELEENNPDLYSRLVQRDPQGGTPITRLLEELQRQRRMEVLDQEQRIKRSRMGQGKRPPKSQRTHERRRKAIARKSRKRPSS